MFLLSAHTNLCLAACYNHRKLGLRPLPCFSVLCRFLFTASTTQRVLVFLSVPLNYDGTYTVTLHLMLQLQSHRGLSRARLPMSEVPWHQRPTRARARAAAAYGRPHGDVRTSASSSGTQAEVMARLVEIGFERNAILKVCREGVTLEAAVMELLDVVASTEPEMEPYSPTVSEAEAYDELGKQLVERHATRDEQAGGDSMSNVGASPGPDQRDAPGPSLTRGPKPAVVAPEWLERVDGWCYAVWIIPGHPESAGIWTGSGRAWGNIEQLLPHRRYRYSDGTRLRRAENATAAWHLYMAGALVHSTVVPPPVHQS